jgi:hypothetical protein
MEPSAVGYLEGGFEKTVNIDSLTLSLLIKPVGSLSIQVSPACKVILYVVSVPISSSL